MAPVNHLDASGLRRALPALAGWLPGALYSSWESDYRDAVEALDDALEGLSEGTATAIQDEVDTVLHPGARDDDFSAILVNLGANLDPERHLGLSGREFFRRLSEAVLTRRFDAPDRSV
ncbi:hypothetical protein [Curtobacterium sp. ER1/6]|uniref:hypothetical protein n=1 Tax=Curtobacterium sp. ER1/6 TaxID=1891920 RepID=UPI00114C993B|nr:hypothetical protein [Curtobacterium sp. ER1/6]